MGIGHCGAGEECEMAAWVCVGPWWPGRLSALAQAGIHKQVDRVPLFLFS